MEKAPNEHNAEGNPLRAPPRGFQPIYLNGQQWLPLFSIRPFRSNLLRSFSVRRLDQLVAKFLPQKFLDSRKYLCRLDFVEITGFREPLSILFGNQGNSKSPTL